MQDAAGNAAAPRGAAGNPFGGDDAFNNPVFVNREPPSNAHTNPFGEPPPHHTPTGIPPASSEAAPPAVAVQAAEVEIDFDAQNSKSNGGIVAFSSGSGGGSGRGEGGRGDGDGGGGDGIVDEILNSAKTILFGSKLNALLVFIPITFVARAAEAGDGLVFALSVLSIIPLAERLGFATEEVAGHTNETIGGLLNATFGNVTEMIVSVFALAAGELRVVQLSLLGSIFTNTLLVLGTAFFAGGLKHKEQTFNVKGVTLNAGLLLVSVVSVSYTHLTLPTILLV